jgi:hypothetical protein
MRAPLLFQIMSICIFMHVLLYATLSVLLPHDAAKTAISWEKRSNKDLRALQVLTRGKVICDYTNKPGMVSSN